MPMTNVIPESDATIREAVNTSYVCENALMIANVPTTTSVTPPVTFAPNRSVSGPMTMRPGDGDDGRARDDPELLD